MSKNIIFLFVLLFLISCSRKNQSGGENTILFVSSNQPVSYIINEITGKPIENLCLLGPGTSSHTYSPKPSDMIAIEKACCIFYVSANLDSWSVNTVNKNKVALMDLLPDSFKLHFKGSHPEHSFSNNLYGTGDLRQEKNQWHVSNPPANGDDPHFWMDPMAVKAIIPKLTEVLIKYHPNDSVILLCNSRKFIEKLDLLNNEIKNALSSVQNRTAFLFHPSMLYLFRRYNIIYGGSIEDNPGKEPTINLIRELAENIKKSGTKAIFIEPQLPANAIKPFVEMTNLPVLMLDPLGGFPGRKNYFDLIRYNAGILKKGLE